MQVTQQIHDIGQSLWLDNITRDLLASGTLKRYIDQWSVTGLTSNPTIFNHAIKTSSAYDAAIRDASQRCGRSPENIFFDVALQDLTQAALLFRAIHQRTARVDGWVSIEVSPTLAYDAPLTLAAARALHARADCPNLFVKIPGTVPGLLAIEEAIFGGIPINITLLFSTAQFEAAGEAYLRGVERRIAAGLNAEVACVASVFISRWDAAVAGQVPAPLQNQLGIAVGLETYRAYLGLFSSPRWLRIFNAGARPQRLLFASTGTKDPRASDTLYVTELALPMSIDTMPEATLKAFADHGQLSTTAFSKLHTAREVLAQFRTVGVDVDAIGAQLQSEGAAAFVASWNELMVVIQQKAAALAPVA